MCGTDAYTSVLNVTSREIILRIKCDNSRCGFAKVTTHKSSSVCNVSFDDMNEAH